MTIDIVTMPLDANGHAICGDAEVWIHDFMGHRNVQWQWRRCAVCDQAPECEITDRVRLTEPCLYPDGITTVVEVAFPSGRIIVTDDLRPVYDWREPDGAPFPSYNSALGQHQAIMAMAAQGCAYGPVQNTCPNLYRLAAPGKFVIASPAYSEDEDDWGECELGFTASEYDGAEKIAGVCTDLWAYSICDHDDYLARGGDPENLKRWTWTVVDAAPGVYRFTHHTGERAFDYDARELIFADIERIGDCA